MNGTLLTCGMLVLACLFSTVSARAETVIGPARLVDGDTLVVDGTTVRLFGLDAPESGQRCMADDQPYDCGAQSSDALRDLIGARVVRCTGTSRDRYDRLLGSCRVGEDDLNRAMVRLGWAVAFVRYSDLYLSEEIEAAKANRGIWRGSFERPTAFRAAKWAAAETVGPDGCRIKGNISSRGQIYHVPWSRHYARTRIDEARGERWFCSEADAIAAGWRAPLR